MINVSVAKIRRAKRCAKDEMLGTDMEQYHHLWSYAATIRETNPGSTVKIKLDTAEEGSQGTFQRLYYCLYACKQGFLDGCRPIIGLDGCFLKSAFGGQLLSAIGRDGNDNMVPIAVAVVEVERYDSWKWFLELLMADLGLGVENIPWTFISDRQKGLVHAVNELFPNSEHRFCLRHMYQNFKQKFKGKELKDLFWAAASVGNEVDWKLAMNSLEKASKDAAEWLQKVPSVLWSRSHFRQSSKCDILVNNLCESFNNYILEARELPVIGMLEWIRRRLMQRIQVKRTGMQKFQGKICPNIAEKIDRNLKFSRLCIPTWDGKNKYEIDCGPRKSVVVDLKEKDLHMWLFPAYRENYLKTYEHTITPVPSNKYWVRCEEQPPKPPAVRRMPGRPKKIRQRAADEPKKGQVSTRKGLVVTCKRCFQPRHNSRTYKNAIHPNSKFYKAPDTNVAESSSELHSSAPSPIPVSGTTSLAKGPLRPTVADVLYNLRSKKARRC
ncbi:uncharacterized protein [Coffea arabica]|uniref:MULE transposase domain-containing protein n=1 Tax=Coffea arabica TaxID=13443 RepID=A0ABM4W8P1_COFAR